MGRKRHRAKASRLPESAYLILGYVRVHANGVHGYRLGRQLSRSPLGLPWLRLGQLYRILHELEHRGLVERQVEVSTSGPSRFLFKATRIGTSTFLRWIASPPRGPASIREQLLHRLHFADLLPPRVLRRFLLEAERECETELKEVHAAANVSGENHREGKALISRALEERLAADRSWLAEVERFVQGASAGPSGNGAGESEAVPPGS